MLQKQPPSPPQVDGGSGITPTHTGRSPTGGGVKEYLRTPLSGKEWEQAHCRAQRLLRGVLGCRPSGASVGAAHSMLLCEAECGREAKCEC